MEAKKAPQDKLYCIAKSCKLLLGNEKERDGGRKRGRERKTERETETEREREDV